MMGLTGKLGLPIQVLKQVLTLKINKVFVIAGCGPFLVLHA